MDLIIGAGITGLSYASFKEDSDYLILERENGIGGYCRTTRRNGYVWDYSGHFFHFQDPHIKDFVMGKIPNCELVEVNKRTGIRYGDLFVDYPFQKNIHQLAKEEFIDCLVDLFSVEGERKYATFKEMLYCKFGKSIAEKFLIPYNEKLYACDLDNLDKDAMGRFFPYAEKEQIVRNFRESANHSYNDKFVYPRGGAIQYVNEIARNIQAKNIRLNAEVAEVCLADKKVVLSNGENISYDRLISTIPFPTLLRLAHLEYDETVYSWNKVLVFNLGFDSKGNDTLTHWVYFPDKDLSFYRVGFYDNILGGPKRSLYVEIGFNKDDKVNPNEWLGKVLHDLRKEKIISEQQTLLDYEAILMNPAYVHITERSNLNVSEKKSLLSKNGVYSIGRYGSWTYCSIEDNIKEARMLAQTLNEK